MRGGVHEGFARLAYQVGISGVVTFAPRKAAAKHTPRAMAKAANELALKLIGTPEFACRPMV